MKAGYVEACSCHLFCLCYFNKHAEHPYCEFNMAVKVREGHSGKTNLTGAKYWLTGDLGDELTAIVEEAHREHLKVADHAIDTASIQTAIEVGADSIEHGNKVTDEQLKQMRDKGIVLDSDAHLVWQLFHEEH